VRATTILKVGLEVEAQGAMGRTPFITAAEKNSNPEGIIAPLGDGR